MEYIEKIDHYFNLFVLSLKEDEIEIETEYGTVNILKKKYEDEISYVDIHTIKEFLAFYLNGALYKVEYLDKTSENNFDINCIKFKMFFPFLENEYLPKNITNANITDADFSKNIESFIRKNEEYKKCGYEIFDDYQTFIEMSFDKLKDKFHEVITGYQEFDDLKILSDNNLQKGNVESFNYSNLDKLIINILLKYPLGIHFIEDKYVLIIKDSFLELFDKEKNIITIYDGVLYDGFSDIKSLTDFNKLCILNYLINPKERTEEEKKLKKYR